MTAPEVDVKHEGQEKAKGNAAQKTFKENTYPGDLRRTPVGAFKMQDAGQKWIDQGKGP